MCESQFSLSLDTLPCNTQCVFRPTIFERITSATNAIYGDTDSMKCIIYLLITDMDSSFQFNSVTCRPILLSSYLVEGMALLSMVWNVSTRLQFHSLHRVEFSSMFSSKTSRQKGKVHRGFSRVAEHHDSPMRPDHNWSPDLELQRRLRHPISWVVILLGSHTGKHSPRWSLEKRLRSSF